MKFHHAIILTIIYGVDIMLIFLKTSTNIDLSWWWILALTFILPGLILGYAVFRAIAFRIWGKKNIKNKNNT